MQVKGLELAMHEPRGKVGVALGYATNEAGADHLVAFHDPIFVNPESVGFKGAMALGITEPTGALDLGEKKVRIWYTGERWNSAEKVLGLCFFGPAPQVLHAGRGRRDRRPRRDGLGRHGRGAARDR